MKTKNKKLKRIMTDLAKGKISKTEAEYILNPKKLAEKRLNKESKGKNIKLNKKEVK